MYVDLSNRASGPASRTPRSNKPEVRNPLLALPSAAREADMPAPAREWLLALLQDLRREAQERAKKAWATRKPPLACYWLAVAVYAGHIGRVLRHFAGPARHG